MNRKVEKMGPVAWLRDIDGTGSLHPCSKGDDGAFPVYEWAKDRSQIQSLKQKISTADELLHECLSDYGNPRFTDRHGMAPRIRNYFGYSEDHS